MATAVRCWIVLLALVLCSWATPHASAQTHVAAHAAALTTVSVGAGDASVVPTVNEGLISGVMTLIVFVAVLFVLSSQVWPKIQGALDAREAKIREEIQAAELAREQARDALAEYERSLQQARAEAQEMLERTRAQQQEMAAELRTKADTQLTELREKAQRDIEAAKRAALNEIYAQAAALATVAAGKILQREIQPADDRRLIDDSLAEMASSAN